MARGEQVIGARELNKRDKRERLRRAAWELFTTLGYERTTTLAIAQRAGIAAGTVFLYAKDKPDLLFLVFERKLSEAMDGGFRAVRAEAPLDVQLEQVFARLLGMYQRNAAVGRQFVKELPGANGPNALRIGALTLEFLRRLGGLVEAAQRRGEVLAEVQPMLGAHSAFALYFMALFTWLSGGMTLRAALETFLRPALKTLVRGMATHPER